MAPPLLSCVELAATAHFDSNLPIGPKAGVGYYILCDRPAVMAILTLLAQQITTLEKVLQTDSQNL